MQVKNNTLKQKTINFDFNINQEVKQAASRSPVIRSNNFIRNKIKKPQLLKSYNGITFISSDINHKQKQKVQDNLNMSQQMNFIELKQNGQRQQMSAQSTRSKSHSGQQQIKSQSKEKSNELMQVISEKKKLKGFSKIDTHKYQGLNQMQKKDQNLRDNNIFFQRMSKEKKQTIKKQSRFEQYYEELKEKGANKNEYLQISDFQQAKSNKFSSENNSRIEFVNVDNQRHFEDCQNNSDFCQESLKISSINQTKIARNIIAKQVMQSENFQHKTPQEENKHNYEILIKQFYVGSGNNGSLISKTLQSKG